MKQSYKEIKEDKSKIESESKNLLESEKKKANKVLETLQSKIRLHQDDLKNSERNVLLKNSDFERDQALLNQKIDHLEKMIQDYKKREKELEANIASLKNENISQMKETSSKSENAFKNLQNRFNELQEKNTELAVIILYY